MLMCALIVTGLVEGVSVVREIVWQVFAGADHCMIQNSVHTAYKAH